MACLIQISLWLKYFWKFIFIITRICVSLYVFTQPFLHEEDGKQIPFCPLLALIYPKPLPDSKWDTNSVFMPIYSLLVLIYLKHLPRSRWSTNSIFMSKCPLLVLIFSNSPPRSRLDIGANFVLFWYWFTLNLCYVQDGTQRSILSFFGIDLP